MIAATLDIGHPNRAIPSLPAATIDSPAVAAACPDNQTLGVFLNRAPKLNVPVSTRLPRQEPGGARRRKAS